MSKFKIIERSSNDNTKSMVIAGTCIIDAIFGIYFENRSYNEVISASLNMIYREDEFDLDLISKEENNNTEFFSDGMLYCRNCYMDSS